jgi:hypothetical protein
VLRIIAGNGRAVIAQVIEKDAPLLLRHVEDEVLWIIAGNGGAHIVRKLLCRRPVSLFGDRPRLSAGAVSVLAIAAFNRGGLAGGVVGRSAALCCAASLDRGAADVDANDPRNTDIYARSGIGVFVVMNRGRRRR